MSWPGRAGENEGQKKEMLCGVGSVCVQNMSRLYHGNTTHPTVIKYGCQMLSLFPPTCWHNVGNRLYNFLVGLATGLNQ